MKRAASILTICAGCLFGQSAPAPNTVTVTASRTANLQPDQVVFRVAVDGPLDSTRDDALNALQGSGITAANFANVGEVQQYLQSGKTQNFLEWSFTLAVPIANTKTTIGLLTAVQQSNAKQSNNLSISFGLQGTQVSPQPCSLADLISDARTQAQQMATAAGKGLGSVLAISSSTSGASSAAVFSASPSIPNCTMTVKFQLTGF